MLTSGTRLGPYEIVAPLGAGGMGEVYKARDTRLDRTVAIKVLPPHAAVDSAFRERFEREARAVSALNHPNICGLYDVGTAPATEAGAPDTQFLVMEFVDGETLEAKLAAKPAGLPVREALQIGIQIADALDKAHRAGIVHRDLKPGNVMITKSGAKLLDFGLAKRGAADAGRSRGAGNPAALLPDLSALVTAPGTLTVQGTLLGTVQYMAPEQVQGGEADTRSDLFAFGALLYEMVTGRKAFTGKSQASVMVAILEHDPPAMATLQPLSPPALDYIVARCLAKDPDDRWQTARDLLAELKRTADPSATSVVSPGAAAQSRTPRQRTREAVAWALAAASLVAAGAIGLLYARRQPVEAQTLQFEVTTPGALAATSGFLQLALSPDGTKLVYAAPSGEGRLLLWLRSLDTMETRPLAGTDTPFHPFWSPGSESIGFFSGGKLKALDISGGLPRTLCDAQGGYGGTWAAKGIILFGTDGPLMRVSADGGRPEAVTALDTSRGEKGQFWPFFLPDGRHFIFTSWVSSLDGGGIYLGSLDSKEVRRIAAAGSQAQYAEPGYLLFLRDTTLVAQRFDAARGQIAGDAVRLADEVATGINNGKAAFSVSANGLLAFRTGGAQTVKTVLTWFDRSGKSVGTVGPPGDYRNPSLSPDGKRVAVDRSESDQSSNRDLWIYDLSTGNPSRFTFEASDDSDAVWSPDGQRIAFGSRSASGVREIRTKATSGLGAEDVVVSMTRRADHPTTPLPTGLFPRDWSRDGVLLFNVFGLPATLNDVDMIVLPGDRAAAPGHPQPLLQTPANEQDGLFSPDEHWFAYQSNASGRPEIYVQPFPVTGAKFQISTAGGVTPRWRSDGKEIFFYAADGMMMAAEVRLGSTLEAGAPKPLFQTSFNGLAGYNGLARFAVSADGQRFLVNVPAEQSSAPPITVVANWSARARK